VTYSLLHSVDENERFRRKVRNEKKKRKYEKEVLGEMKIEMLNHLKKGLTQ